MYTFTLDNYSFSASLKIILLKIEPFLDEQILSIVLLSLLSKHLRNLKSGKNSHHRIILRSKSFGKSEKEEGENERIGMRSLCFSLPLLFISHHIIKGMLLTPLKKIKNTHCKKQMTYFLLYPRYHLTYTLKTRVPIIITFTIISCATI